MARKGPAPKPMARRQGHGAHTERPGASVLTVIQEPPREIPPMPAGLLVATKRDWSNYWSSAPALVAIAVDFPTVERRFRLLDEWRRAMNAYRRNRVVEGSMGQPVVNPLAKQASALEREIRALDAELGLTPLARMKLGMAVGAARKQLEDIQRDAQLEHDVDDDDPRAALVLADTND